MNHHPKHQIILAVDFNQYILLKGKTSKGTTSPPTKMTMIGFTSCATLDLTLLQPRKFYKTRRSHYTSTSLIDDFYSNLPNHNNLQCHMWTNHNQNSNHYPIQLQLAPTSIITKGTQPPTNNPYIIYPTLPTNLQKLQTPFLNEQSLSKANLTKTSQQEQLTHT